jgi:endoribonuclease Dicer
VIREYTDLDAVECHGASGVGDWNARQWKEAIGTKEVRAPGSLKPMLCAYV